MHKVHALLAIVVSSLFCLQANGMQSGLVRRSISLLEWKLPQAPHRILGVEKNASSEQIYVAYQDFYKHRGNFGPEELQSREQAFDFFKRFHDQRTLKYDQFLDAEKNGTTDFAIFWQRLKRVCKGVVFMSGSYAGYKYLQKPAGPKEYQDMRGALGVSDCLDVLEELSLEDIQRKCNAAVKRKRSNLDVLSSHRAYEVFKHAVLVNDIDIAKDMAGSGKISADQMKGYLQELIDQKDWKLVKSYLQLFPIEQFSFDVSFKEA